MLNRITPYRHMDCSNRRFRFTQYCSAAIGLIFIFTSTLIAQADDLAGQTDLTNTKTISVTASEFSKLGNNFPYKNYFNADELLSWQITSPTQAATESPLGVLVYISPTQSGGIPEEWKSVLINKRLIWISADNAGNPMNPHRRVIQALFAVQWVLKNYTINPKRIYISGFSGGGRVASMMAPLYPSLFSGGIFMGGANEFNYTKSEFSQLQKNRYAFINGEKDFNLAESRKIFKKLNRDGISQTQFFEVPKLDHHFPPAEYLASAIDFLDASDTHTTAPSTF